jgi:hypothetical protein
MATTLALLLAFGFTSCKKEGIFNPKHKIARIYVETENGEKVLSETYAWSKNHLERIKSELSSEVMTFEYNKNNQITKINSYLDDVLVSYADVTYKNGKYDNIVIHTPGLADMDFTYSFTYSGKKIKSLTISIPSLGNILDNLDVKKSYRAIDRISSFFMPAALPVETAIKSMNSKASPSQNITMTYNLNWKDNNIEQMRADIGNTTITFNGYDSKTNPFQGFMVINPFNLNKNNPATITYNMQGEIGTINYSYVYDGDVPVKITTTFMGNVFPQGIGSWDNNIKYYEYQ